jgi:hypothetical protein
MLESNIKCCLFLYLKLCFVAFKITYESNILYLYSAHILMRLLGWDVLGERIKLIVGKITYIYFFQRKTSTYLVISPCDINKQAEEGGHEKECEWRKGGLFRCTKQDTK